MKTIAIDIRPLIADIGGVPEYTRHVISRMVRNYPEYFYIFFLNSFHGVHNEDFFSAKNCMKVFFRCPSKIFNMSLMSCGLPHIDTLIQKRIRRRIDLFFAPNIDFFSFSGTVPTVVTFHDLTFDIYAECFSKKQRLWHRMVNPRRIFHTATRCIAVSERTKRDMVYAYGTDEKKICVIPLGIDDIFFKNIPLTLQKDNMHAMPQDYILALGARDKRKNALHVIRAYADAQKKEPRMTHWKLCILGGSDPLPELRSAVKQQGISESVFFLDSVSADMRRVLFSHARVFVYPSLYEGFGLPPLEAMACGTPVISAAHSSLSEISGEGSYCVDPYRTSSLSRALIDCAIDERIRARYIEKGHACVQKFSWDTSAKKTHELFESVMTAYTYDNRH
ncbi:glycosyltransferase family 4 protein [Candidatus Uhrbacteria bacterium]|nr:glycosyltransferase family 4 protein [Candidatus Uhrbacteria bacterium]